MKIHSAISYWLLAITLATAAEAPTLERGPVGRYQLLAGPVELLSRQGRDTTTQARSVILRLDTTTGRTWEYTTLNIDGKSIRGWIQVPEDTSKAP